MKKKVLISSLLLFGLTLTGCTSQVAKEETKETATSSVKEEKQEKKEQTISYLDKEYQVKFPTKNIVAASLEPMEDAVALGVKPTGAVSVGNDIPEYVASDLGKDVVNVGDKFSPNVELLTGLKPDVILGSSKFDDSVTANLEKIAPTINVSHLSGSWKDNLVLLGELSGKKEKADELIKEYEKDLEKLKENHKEISDQSIVILRVRDGELCMYGNQVYYNPMFYDEVGFKKPTEIDKVKGQETISVEQFSKINPDILLVQFAAGENKGHENFVDELKSNPVFKSMKAVKNDKVYFDIVDGGYQGGTYLSKKIMLEKLSGQILN